MTGCEKKAPVDALIVEEVVTRGIAGAMEKVRFCDPEPPAFEAVILEMKFPLAVGVPEMTPVVALIPSPKGSPEAANAVGEFVAVTEWENGTPQVAETEAGLEIAGTMGSTWKSRLLVAVPAGFVAERFTVKLPSTLGVPVMLPVVELIDRPGGRPDAPNERGALVELIVRAKGREILETTVPLF